MRHNIPTNKLEKKIIKNFRIFNENSKEKQEEIKNKIIEIFKGNEILKKEDIYTSFDENNDLIIKIINPMKINYYEKKENKITLRNYVLEKNYLNFCIKKKVEKFQIHQKWKARFLKIMDLK